jgi:hypothetical protein
MDKAYKTWDNNPKEDNLEDGALVLEQLENALFYDDDRGEMPPPSTAMVTLTRTPAAELHVQFHLHRYYGLHYHYHVEAHMEIMVVPRGRKSR